MTDEVLRKINKAKVNFMIKKNTTFFSSLLASLKLQETTKVPTAATDGVYLYYSRSFVEELHDLELEFLLLHEVYHVALDHISRCKSKDLDKHLYNIAADYYINNELTNLGYVLPPGGLVNHEYDGWSTQQIYDHLDKNAITIEFTDDILPSPDGMSDHEHRETVTGNIVRAATQAKLAGDPGSIPGEVERLLGTILNPKLPWTVILQKHLSTYAKNDYNWKRPNRRMWPDLYLPSLRSESLDLVTVGIDVSGSIDQDQLTEFVSEVRFIWETMLPQNIRIMTFDTCVRKNVLLQQGDSIEDVKWYGGGGTNLNPLIKSIKEEEPVFALIFSDFEVSMPNLEGISSDLYWIRIGDFPWNPPIGEVIDLV